MLDSQVPVVLSISTLCFNKYFTPKRTQITLTQNTKIMTQYRTQKTLRHSEYTLTINCDLDPEYSTKITLRQPALLGKRNYPPKLLDIDQMFLVKDVRRSLINPGT